MVKPPSPVFVPKILHQDSHYVVLDKPAGLPCHPGRDGGPSIEDGFPALSRRRDGPWLAHRLDRDTAGCLLIALRHAALLAAQAAFAQGRAQKTYWAVVVGHPPQIAGNIVAPLARHTNPATGKWHMAPSATGAEATTDWRVLGQADGLSLLELHPHTGRTHQIRAHCAALGCPVLGDAVYGNAAPTSPLQLLARALAMPFSPALHAVAPVPAHMQAAVAACGGGA